MPLIAQPANIFTSVKEYFFPNLAIGRMPETENGPMPKTQQSVKVASKPLAMRTLKQQLEEGGYTPMGKRASDPFSFTNRFKLLILSIRIKHTKSVSALKALKADIKTAMEELDRAKYPTAYGELKAKKLAVENSLSEFVAQQNLLSTNVPTYQGFVPARFFA